MVLGVSESFVSNRGNDVLGITIWRVCIIYTVHTLQHGGGGGGGVGYGYSHFVEAITLLTTLAP